MRFPFTFMGLISIGFGAWIVLFVALHRAGPVELAAAAVMFAFGAFVLYRRARRGREA
jgi:hypothetical protein